MCPRHAKISPDKSNVHAWLSGGQVSPFLQLATSLTEVTRRHAPSRHRSRRCLSCWRTVRCSWSRSLIPCVRARRCWAIICGFLRRDTIAGGTGTQAGRVRSRDAVFTILQRLVDADFAAVEIGFYAQCWSCFRNSSPNAELDVGWSELLLFIFNYANRRLELMSHCLTSDWQLKHCDTFCSMTYIFKGHLNNIRKWLFIFETS